jgi:predicted 3-demethylubiquinone-9 3-methyltransferase (glyoxalase superfamily)
MMQLIVTILSMDSTYLENQGVLMAIRILPHRDPAQFGWLSDRFGVSWQLNLP